MNIRVQNAEIRVNKGAGRPVPSIELRGGRLPPPLPITHPDHFRSPTMTTSGHLFGPGLLGAARGRRQLRHRHLLHLPAAPGGHGGGRDHPVAGRPYPGGTGVVPRLPPAGTRGRLRLLPAVHHPARSPVPRRTPRPEDVRHRVVPHRRPEPLRRGPHLGAGAGTAGVPLRDADAVPRATEHARRDHPRRVPVVLARRLLRPCSGRRAGRPSPLRRAHADTAFAHAPVSGGRGRPPGAAGGHRVEPPGRRLVRRLRRGRPRPGQRRDHQAVVRRLLGGDAALLHGRLVRELHGYGRGRGAESMPFA